MATRRVKKIRFSPINEQIVIGSMIKNKSLRKRLVKELSVKNFTGERHKSIFSALVEITERNLEPTPGTIHSFIPDETEYGGNNYLSKIESLASDDNIDYHIVRTKWDVERLKIITKKIPELESVLKDTRLDPEDTLDVINSIQNKIKNININDNSFQTGKDITAKYRAIQCAREIGVFTRDSGYAELDKKLVECFSPGKITVVSAAPSIGKTSFCINLTARQAKRYKVCYMPWEGGIESTLDSLCSSQLNIPLWKLIKRPDLLSDEDKKRQSEFFEEYIETHQISFLERPPKSLFEGKRFYEINNIVMDWFESKIDEIDADIIYWDLFEKMFPDTQPSAIMWNLNRLQEIISKRNKHMVILHQITFKEVEKNRDKRPTRATLKGSGAYLEVPDFVFTLYREGFYDRSVTDDTIELTCWKQRRGPLFRILFTWDGPTVQVSGGKEISMYNDNSDIEV